MNRNYGTENLETANQPFKPAHAAVGVGATAAEKGSDFFVKRPQVRKCLCWFARG